MEPMNGFKLTTHAVDRLYERHPGIFSDPTRQGAERYTAACRVLSDAEEHKAVKNNTAFMVFLHEKYGFDKDFHFFVNGDVLFIGIIQNGKRLITTTMSCMQHRIPHLRNAVFQREDRFGRKAAPVRYRKFENRFMGYMTP